MRSWKQENNWKDSSQKGKKKEHRIIHKMTNVTSNNGQLTVYIVIILCNSKLKWNTSSFNNLWMYYLEKSTAYYQLD